MRSGTCPNSEYGRPSTKHPSASFVVLNSEGVADHTCFSFASLLSCPPRFSTFLARGKEFAPILQRTLRNEIADASAKEETVSDRESTSRRTLFTGVLTDVQFWVPVAVLVAGLLLLVWIR